MVNSSLFVCPTKIDSKTFDMLTFMTWKIDVYSFFDDFIDRRRVFARRKIQLGAQDD